GASRGVRSAQLPETGAGSDEEVGRATHEGIRSGRARRRLPADPPFRDGKALRKRNRYGLKFPMALPRNKTKIVATIGPASETPAMLERPIRAGLNVARLNFSHGDLTDHAERIKRIRSAAEAAGRRVAIMADLPGPKMRIGKIEPEPIQLHAGEKFILTTEEIPGTSQGVSVSLKDLPKGVKPGDRLFLYYG